MSLKLNIFFNYLSQFYTAFVGILIIPIYLRLMGGEAYGLVAFFAMLQAWFQILDLGLGATMARESARYAGGGGSATELRRLLRCMELLFWAVGLVAALTVAVFSGVVAEHWLGQNRLDPDTLLASLRVMAFAVGIRWVSGLYRGVVTGLERQVWLSVFSMGIATLRFIGVVPLLVYIDRGPLAFFYFQAAVSVVELALLWHYVYRRIPVSSNERMGGSWAPLRAVFKFSATVAFTSCVWVLVTQTDKLLISRFLPLADYGYFTAAVLLASSVTLLSGPIAQALLPRLTRLQQEGREAEFILLYRRATQAIAVVAGSASLVLAVYARPALWAWTGDEALAARYASVLALYAIGNGFLALAAFPYYLQYAKGDLRLHLWGNLVFVLLLLPSIVMATSHFGAEGAAAVWMLTNAIFFFLWTPIVHRRFLPTMHRRWLLGDVLKVLVLPALAAGVASTSADWALSRPQWGVMLAASAILLGILGVVGSSLLVRFEHSALHSAA